LLEYPPYFLQSRYLVWEEHKCKGAINGVKGLIGKRYGADIPFAPPDWFEGGLVSGFGQAGTLDKVYRVGELAFLTYPPLLAIFGTLEKDISSSD